MSHTVETPATAGPALLTAADRCDACGARAYAQAILDVVVLRDPVTDEVTGHQVKDLLFCGHHWTKYKTKVMAVALEHHEELHLR